MKANTALIALLAPGKDATGDHLGDIARRSARKNERSTREAGLRPPCV